MARFTANAPDTDALERFGRFIWGDPDARVRKNGTVRQIERAISAIRGFSMLGLIPVVAYGAVAAYCSGAGCVDLWGGTMGVLRGMSLALLAALSAFAAGGMLGFVFGLPRWGESPAVQQTVVQQSPQTQPGAAGSQQTVTATAQTDGASVEAKAAEAGQPKSAATRGDPPNANASAPNGQGAAGGTRGSRVRPNTGLEKVMDWLTTLIVGLGLVHLRDGIGYVKKTSGWVTAAIAGSPGIEPSTNFAAGAAILIPYAIAGFFLVYLWAQRYMGREMAQADYESQLLEDVKDELEKKNEKALDTVAKVTEQMLNRLPDGARSMQTVRGAQDFVVPSATQELEGVDHATAGDIARRYAAARAWEDEPMMSFGPEQAGGWRMEGLVRQVADGMRLYEVSLAVKPVSGSELKGEVVFLLHHTLPNPVRRVQAVNSVATLIVHCTGAFVAGAIVVESGTRLALDLAQLPNAPQDFKDN
jgi:hypothetical protein